MGKKNIKIDRQQDEETKSFLPSKKYREKIFTVVYGCIKNGMYPLQIAQYMSKKTGQKWTKQRVNHWIKQLLRRGLIEKNMKHVYTEYASSGTSKKFLIGDERVKNFDLHNIEITIPLKRIGNLPKGNINMNNWSYATMNFGNFTVNVNYGKQPKLKIFPPNTYGNEISEVLIRCGSEVRCIVGMLEDNFKCSARINDLSVRRKPHLHAKKDPVIEQIDKEKIQYHGKNIEFNRSGDAHGDILGFEGMNKYDQLLNNIPALVNILDQRIEKFSENISSHLALIQDYRHESMNNRKIMKEMTESLKNAVLKGFNDQGHSPSESMGREFKPTKEREESSNLIHIKTLMAIPGFIGDKNGKLHNYPELKGGCDIWIEKKIANMLIKQDKAIEI